MAKNLDYDDEGEDDEVESSDDDDEVEEEFLQSDPRPNAVYNSVALHEKLEEIGWPDGLDWTQTLCVDYQLEAADIDVEDDLAREMAFYTQALEGTREAFSKLLNTGTPFLRPSDYYAEMVKSDTHMLKVKDMLLSQKKQMDEAEERRKARESKRFSKEVQAQKLKQKAKEKKQNIESVKKWRKMRQDQGFEDGGGEGEFPVDFDHENDGADARSSKKGSREPHKNFKRRGNHGEKEFHVDFNDDDGASKKRKRGDSHSHSPGKFRRNSFGGKSRGQPLGSEGPHRTPNAGNAVSDSHSPGKFRRNSFGGKSRGQPLGSHGPHRTPNAAPWDRSGGKGNSSKGGKGKPFQKRQSRNAKYGHGGRKSFKKANTAESSAGFFGSKQKKSKF